MVLFVTYTGFLNRCNSNALTTILYVNIKVDFGYCELVTLAWFSPDCHTYFATLISMCFALLFEEMQYLFQNACSDSHA